MEPGIGMRFVRRILPILLLVAFTVCGALMFGALESDNYIATKSAEKEAAIVHRTEAIVNLTKAMDFCGSTTLEDCDIIKGCALTKDNQTCIINFPKLLVWYELSLGLEFDADPLNPWDDMASAVMYCVSVYTTVGWGKVYTSTVNGRIATMIYAVIGIPLMLVVLATVTEFIKLGMKQFSSLFTRHCKKRTGRKIQRWMVIFMAVAILAVLIVVFAFFMADPDRGVTYWDSIWFGFISMSTIGFGDVMPAHSMAVLMLFFVMTSLATFPIVLAAVQGIIDDHHEDDGESDFEEDSPEPLTPPTPTPRNSVATRAPLQTPKSTHDNRFYLNNAPPSRRNNVDDDGMEIEMHGIVNNDGSLTFSRPTSGVSAGNSRRQKY